MSESEDDSPSLLSDVALAYNAIRYLQIDWVSFLLWPCVFSLNMIIPLHFSTFVTKDHGQAGVFAASVLLLAGGVIYSLSRPSKARKIILGAAVFAITQIFPVIHVIIGGIAFFVAECLLLADHDSRLNSELGGFIVTLIVGSALMACASMLGFLLAQGLPRWWFKVDPDVIRRRPVKASND